MNCGRPQGNVGLEQRGAHLAQGGIDIGLGERAAPAKLAKTFAQTFAQTFEHPDPSAQIDIAPMREPSRIDVAPEGEPTEIGTTD